MDFSSQVDVVDEVTRQIKITIPADEIRKAIEGEMAGLSKTAVVKGFRPGKAPRAMLESLYGERIRFDVAHKMINTSLNQVSEEREKIEVVGSPEVDIVSMEAGKDLQFNAKVSLFPSPSITNYQEITVKVKKREVTEEEIDKIVESMRGAKATMKKIESRDAAQMGDVVDLSLTVESEGQKGDRPEPLVVGLGEKKLPDFLENAIVGMKVGATREIDANFKEGENTPDLAGKQAKYKIVLNAIFEKILPELNDTFAKESQLEVDSVAALREKIRSELVKEKEQESRSDIQVALLDDIISKNEFKVPQILLDDEIKALLVRAGVADQKKIETTDLESFRGELGPIALKRVRSAIVLDRIGEAEKIKAEKDDIEKEIAELAARSGVSVEQARKYIYDRSRLVSFLMEITRSKVLNYLVSKTKVEYLAD